MASLRALQGSNVSAFRSGADGHNPFLVESVIDETAVLRPTTPDGRAFAASLAEGEGISIGSPAPTGLLVAEVLVQRWSPQNRMLLVSSPLGVANLQRREHRRVRMAIPVDVVLAEPEHTLTLNGTTVDLSLGGFAAELAGEAPGIGEAMLAVLRPPGEPVVVVAEVVGTVTDPTRRRPVTRARFRQLRTSTVSPLTMAMHQAELARVRPNDVVAR